MINARVAELLREPANIQPEDLRNIATEIGRFPYAQSLRALQLYGVHKFDTARYNAQLSETAAYTANKKNLYQLINGAAILKEQKPITSEEQVPHATPEPPQEESVKSKFNIHHHPGIKHFAKPEPVFVNGVLNRILFKGEENFMNEPTPVIDVEITKESGTLVVQYVDSCQQDETDFKTDEAPDVHNAEEKESSENLNKQYLDESTEAQPKTEEPLEQQVDHAQLSFHRTEDFLPKVEFKTSVKTQQPPAILLSKDNKTNRHELEMQRLIAEVEAKMKASKAQKQVKKEEDEGLSSSEINFAETADFTLSTEESKTSVVDVPAKNMVPMEGNISTSGTPADEWKPMSFSFGASISDLDKNVSENHPDQIESAGAEPPTKPVEERPVINVSFFSQEVLPIEEQDAQPETKSNIPQFVNTWQNWLKLGKKEQAPQSEDQVADKTEAPVEEIKSAVIEKFIENEPKISRFNEESTYTVRDRGDDISHLMTETLANLYVEQRLYAKAIRAFELLSEKYPDRVERYKSRIEEIKLLRQK